MTERDEREISHNENSDVTIEESGRAKKSFFSEVLHVVIIAAFVVLPIRILIAQPFIVSGASMYPTFDNGDYLIIDQLTYRIEEPERGEVVVFRYPNDPSKFFIKRIIGLPGEKVEVTQGNVIVTNDNHPNGMLIEEPYISEMHSDPFTLTLGSQEYFVLGDNRDESSDSRVWGPLPRDLIVGRAYLRLLPINEIGILPGDYSAFVAD